MAHFGPPGTPQGPPPAHALAQHIHAAQQHANYQHMAHLAMLRQQQQQHFQRNGGGQGGPPPPPHVIHQQHILARQQQMQAAAAAAAAAQQQHQQQQIVQAHAAQLRRDSQEQTNREQINKNHQNNVNRNKSLNEQASLNKLSHELNHERSISLNDDVFKHIKTEMDSRSHTFDDSFDSIRQSSNPIDDLLNAAATATNPTLDSLNQSLKQAKPKKKAKKEKKEKKEKPEPKELKEVPVITGVEIKTEAPDNNGRLDSQDSICDEMDGDKSSHTKKSRPNHSLIEKRRRDKMKSHIQELASMVPMCSAIAQNKLDKFTVLRLALQHIKTLIGSTSGQAKPLYKPTFIADDELRSLMVSAADGFVMIADSEQGQILFISKSVKQVLGVKQEEMVGRSLFDMVATNEDVTSFKKFIEATESPKEKLIDIKTGSSINSEHKNMTLLQPGCRRVFFTRLRKPPPMPKIEDLYPKISPERRISSERKMSQSGEAEMKQESGDMARRDSLESNYGSPKEPVKKKSKKSFSGQHQSQRMHFPIDDEVHEPVKIGASKLVVQDQTHPVSIFGYLKTISSYNGFLDEEEGIANLEMDKNSSGNITEQQRTCFVCVVRPTTQLPSKPKTLPLRALQFSYRLNLDGKILSTDERITSILGYMQQDIKKTSIYEYISRDDINKFSQAHASVLNSNDKILTGTYKLRTCSGSKVPIRSKMYTFRNPFTGKAQYIICQSVVDMDTIEAKDSGMQNGVHIQQCQSTESMPNLKKSDILGGHQTLGAGKIGQFVHSKIRRRERMKNKHVVPKVPKIRRDSVKSSSSGVSSTLPNAAISIKTASKSKTSSLNTSLGTNSINSTLSMSLTNNLNSQLHSTFSPISQIPPEISLNRSQHFIPTSAAEIFDKIAENNHHTISNFVNSGYHSTPTDIACDFDSDLLSSIVKQEHDKNPTGSPIGQSLLENLLSHLNSDQNSASNEGAAGLHSNDISSSGNSSGGGANITSDSNKSDSDTGTSPELKKMTPKPKSPDSGCETSLHKKLKALQAGRFSSCPPTTEHTSDSDGEKHHPHNFHFHRHALDTVDQHVKKLFSASKDCKSNGGGSGVDEQMELLLGVLDAAT